MDKEATTMSVREMRELLGIKKTDSYWLLKKNCFEVVKIAGKMRIVKKLSLIHISEPTRP